MSQWNPAIRGVVHKQTQTLSTTNLKKKSYCTYKFENGQNDRLSHSSVKLSRQRVANSTCTFQCTDSTIIYTPNSSSELPASMEGVSSGDSSLYGRLQCHMGNDGETFRRCFVIGLNKWQNTSGAHEPVWVSRFWGRLAVVRAFN